MHTIKILLKRDIELGKSTERRRFFLFLISMLLLDISTVLAGKVMIFIRGIEGITAEEFLSFPGSMPYVWIWMNIGSVLISFDIVRKDIFVHASNIIVKLKHRYYFWMSKMLYGVCLTFLITTIIVIEKVMLIALLQRQYVSIVFFSYQEMFKVYLYTFLCSYSLYSIYHTISLFENEIFAFLLTVIVVLIGMPMKASFLFTNVFMLSRTDGFGGVLVTIIVVAGSFLIGAVKITTTDITIRRWGDHYE